MNDPDQADRMFDQNLQTFGRSAERIPRPTDALRTECSEAMNTARQPARSLRLAAFKRPAILSTVGIAASIAMVVGWLAPWQTNQMVQAAEILAKLNTLTVEGQMLDITIDSVAVDDVFINGHFQVSEEGVAGEIEVIVNDDDDGPIELDVALGVSPEDGWVLVRKLSVPDAGATAIIGLLLPPGTETLLKLPEAIRAEISSAVHGEIGDAIAELRSGHIADVLKEIIRSHDEVGATVDTQSDGTILLQLRITDQDTLEALGEIISRSIEKKVDANSDDDEKGNGNGADEDNERTVVRRKHVHAHVSAHAHAHGIGNDADDELVGSTLRVVYDPATERVESFGIVDFGDQGGSINVAIVDGAIDAALLDSSLVVSGNTRTIDLSQLEALFSNLQLRH